MRDRTSWEHHSIQGLSIIHVNGIEVAVIEYDDLDDLTENESEIERWAIEVFDFYDMTSDFYITPHMKAVNFKRKEA